MDPAKTEMSLKEGDKDPINSTIGLHLIMPCEIPQYYSA